ncbi:hypothetical protein D3C80_412740 [compost metagenome]
MPLLKGCFRTKADTDPRLCSQYRPHRRQAGSHRNITSRQACTVLVGAALAGDGPRSGPGYRCPLWVDSCLSPTAAGSIARRSAHSNASLQAGISRKRIHPIPGGASRTPQHSQPRGAPPRPWLSSGRHKHRRNARDAGLSARPIQAPSRHCPDRVAGFLPSCGCPYVRPDVLASLLLAKQLQLTTRIEPCMKHSAYPKPEPKARPLVRFARGGSHL